MVVPILKRKTRSSTNTEHLRSYPCKNICSVFFRSYLCLILLTNFSLFLLYLLLSFTTVISNNIFHVCAFTRDLNNDPYCLTVGFHIPNNLTKSIVLGRDAKLVSEKYEAFTGVIPGNRVSDDLNKTLHSQDEMGSPTNSTFAGDRLSDEKEYFVLEQEDEPKNLDSPKNVLDNQENLKNLDQEHKPKNLGSPKNVLDKEENIKNLDHEDKPKNLGSPKKVLDKEENLKNLTSPKKVLDKEENLKNLDKEDEPKNLGSPKNALDKEENLKNLDQEDEPKNLGSPKKVLDKDENLKNLSSPKNVLDKEENLKNLDQEHKPKNKVSVDSLIDRKVEEEYSKYIKPKTQRDVNGLRSLTKFLYLQRSWQSSTNYSVNIPRSCEGKGVYVYDLPSKFNRDLLVDCYDILRGVNLCSYFKNEGFGEVIENLGQRWFGTHMYSLEPILHVRVLKHPCRVYNESQANLFYVPYYGGFDVLRWHYRNVSNDVKDRLGLEVLKWLESKESWRRNTGKDHVFVLGKITWDFRRTKHPWGSRFLELQEMQNPTKLLIERQPWQVNDIAIPHPTYFHPKTDDDITNWQAKIMSKPRKSLVSFAGAARPGIPNNIRSTLIEQCVSSDQCQLLDCNAHRGICKKPENIIALFQDSEFCLQPPGDSATRRSVFDSLISGCIPVIFNPYTAYYQYTWHLPEDHQRYSVYISEEDVKEKRVNVVETLMAKTLKEKEDMRSYIVHQLLPGLVYGDPNAKFEKFRDAFDITFDTLIEKINKCK